MYCILLLHDLQYKYIVVTLKTLANKYNTIFKIQNFSNLNFKNKSLNNISENQLKLQNLKF